MDGTWDILYQPGTRKPGTHLSVLRPDQCASTQGGFGQAGGSRDNHPWEFSPSRVVVDLNWIQTLGFIGEYQASYKVLLLQGVIYWHKSK